METTGSRAITRRLRGLALARLDARQGRDYRWHAVRPRLRRLNPEWLQPLMVFVLVQMAQPNVSTSRLLTVLYATGLVFWVAAQLRLRVHGRDAALTGYHPVSDARYFSLQWHRVVRSVAPPALVSLWLLVPGGSGPLSLASVLEHGGRSYLSLGPLCGRWALNQFASLGWPLAHLALALLAALIVYRRTPGLPCRAVAAMVWTNALLAALAQTAQTSPFVPTVLLPAGWLEALQQLTDVPRVASAWRLVLVVPVVALLASYRRSLAIAAGTFHVHELILSTPNDPTPQVPTGPGSDESPQEAVDTSPAARGRRRQRRMLQGPTARQVLRSEIDGGRRMWRRGGIERLVGALLSSRDRTVIRFFLGGDIDWSARYRSALLATLAGTVALMTPSLLPLLRSLGQRLGLAAGPSWNGSFEQVSGLLLFAGFSMGGCCIAYSAWRAAPLCGGGWRGLSSIPLASGVGIPMHAGFPVGFTEAYWAMLRVNVVRILLWLPLLAIQVRVFAIQYWPCISGDLQDVLNLVPFMVVMLLMAQPLLLVLRHLAMGGLWATLGGMLAAAGLIMCYVVPQIVALGALWMAAHAEKAPPLAFPLYLSALASLVGFWAAFVMASAENHDLLCVSPEGGIVMDG